MTEHPASPRLGLWAVALFLVFGVAAALIVPTDYSVPRPTPPDEGAHIGFIQYLGDHLHLPVFSAQSTYEAHQPPLYYWSATPVYWIIRLVSGPAPGAPSGAGLIICLRLWSVLLAAPGVWIAWLLGRRLFPQSPLLSLAPALCLALWPGRTLMLSAVTNDGLAEALCLLSFYLCVVILQEGLTSRRAGYLGVAWALALLTKSTSMALGPIVLLTIVMASRTDDEAQQQRQQQEALKALLIIAGLVAGIAGWWFVRNQLLYGDPMAAEIFNRLFKIDRATPEYFLKFMSGGAYYVMVVINTALSFWGVYGQANVWSPEWYYVLGFLIWALALVGLLRERLAPVRAASSRDQSGKTPAVGAASSRDRSRQDAARPGVEGDWRRQVWILAWLLFATVLVLFLRFNTEFYQAQARYLFAANGPIALLMVLGLWDLDRSRWGVRAVVLALALMLIMSIWSVFGFSALVAAYNPPPFLGSM